LLLQNVVFASNWKSLRCCRCGVVTLQRPRTLQVPAIANQTNRAKHVERVVLLLKKTVGEGVIQRRFLLEKDARVEFMIKWCSSYLVAGVIDLDCKFKKSLHFRFLLQIQMSRMSKPKDRHPQSPAFGIGEIVPKLVLYSLQSWRVKLTRTCHEFMFTSSLI
jgi:hypothetical protein